MFNLFKKKEVSKEELFYERWIWVKNKIAQNDIMLGEYGKEILKEHSFRLENLIYLRNKFKEGKLFYGTYVEKDFSISKNFHEFDNFDQLMHWFLENGVEENPVNGQAIFFIISELIVKNELIE